MINNKDFPVDVNVPGAIREEVVRYVQIPSSFPHFPRLTELYASAPTFSGIWGKSHSSIPINNQKKVRIQKVYDILDVVTLIFPNRGYIFYHFMLLNYYFAGSNR